MWLARLPTEVGALETSSAPELPGFALVRAEEGGRRHALPPGAECGPALCGLAQPEGEWFISGYTKRPFLIPCQGCRRGADEVLVKIDEDTWGRG
jgi:hypothetical protein